ncbi:site-specific integrase [Microvirga sp. KLBC 81]|uniref:tyrosine-type recombinase/integrase n=1 Tax=Microvirga sp. KLBC 81 TaxID=1862707 RepID=UPI001FE03BBA|nr:tyrosine-type recombinase/integrase [Microvirga sp. KLBC 81]
MAEFIERYAKPRNRTWPETERLLTRADLASWQNRDIRSISRQEILEVLDRMVERGAPVQANRLVAAMRRFFGWAVERGLLEASPMAALKPPSAEVSRDRVLSDAELAAIWRAAGEIGFPFGSAVQLMILTGQRRAEVLEAEWREFDLGRGLWTIPCERSKNGGAHLIPLAPAAVELLRAVPRIGPNPRLVFTTTGLTPFSGVSKAFARLTELAGRKMSEEHCLEPWRLHDLRRTFATGCARLSIPLHVVEKCLNHVSGSFGGIIAVYQRHDFLNERVQAMSLWAEHILQLQAEN